MNYVIHIELTTDILHVKWVKHFKAVVPMFHTSMLG